LIDKETPPIKSSRRSKRLIEKLAAKPSLEETVCVPVLVQQNKRESRNQTTENNKHVASRKSERLLQKAIIQEKINKPRPDSVENTPSKNTSKPIIQATRRSKRLQEKAKTVTRVQTRSMVS